MSIEYTQPVKARKWYEIWWEIWRNPGEASFLALLSESDHSTMRGFIWIAVASLFVAIITGTTGTRTLQSFEPGIPGGLLAFGCALILTPIFGVIGLVISSGIFHGISRLLGGRGVWNDMVICLAAVAAPSELIGGVIGLLTILFIAIPGAFFIPWVLSFVFGIYAVILNIIAIKAAEKMGTGQAVLTYFLPVIIIGLLVLCAFLALIPAFRTTS